MYIPLIDIYVHVHIVDLPVFNIYVHIHEQMAKLPLVNVHVRVQYKLYIYRVCRVTLSPQVHSRHSLLVCQ
jgi:hypothetical protein